MGLLPDSQSCGLRMRRERFPHYRLQRKPLVRDPGMHHGTCMMHVPWCMSGSLTCGCGENIPGIPGACATRNFTYLERGPWCWVKKSHGRLEDVVQVGGGSDTALGHGQWDGEKCHSWRYKQNKTKLHVASDAHKALVWCWNDLMLRKVCLLVGCVTYFTVSLLRSTYLKQFHRRCTLRSVGPCCHWVTGPDPERHRTTQLTRCCSPPCRPRWPTWPWAPMSATIGTLPPCICVPHGTGSASEGWES